MTEKEKMIEEMAKHGCYDGCASGFKQFCEEYAGKPCKNMFRIARGLCEHGYRKIPEGSVVLTKEEYSDYLTLKNDYAHAKEKCEKLQADNERLYKNIGKFKEQVRKETAKEILQEVGKACGDYQWFKNLCKQYGVEE